MKTPTRSLLPPLITLLALGLLNWSPRLSAFGQGFSIAPMAATNRPPPAPVTLQIITNLPDTNSAGPPPPALNPQPSTAVLNNQFAAAARAMNSFFETRQDQVTRKITVDQPDYDHLGDGLGVELICWVTPEQAGPGTIVLHLSSQSEDWRFLDDNTFTLRADDLTKDYGDQKDYSKVLTEGVNEQFMIELTPEELHQYAWADEVWFKLGYMDKEIPYATRQKWKLFWKYFDLKKELANQAATAAAGN